MERRWEIVGKLSGEAELCLYQLCHSFAVNFETGHAAIKAPVRPARGNREADL